MATFRKASKFRAPSVSSLPFWSIWQYLWMASFTAWRVRQCAKLCRITGEKRRPKVKFRMKSKREHRRHAVRVVHPSMRWHSFSDHWPNSDDCPRHASMWHIHMLSNDRKWNVSLQSCLGVRLPFNWTHRQSNHCHTRPASTHFKFQTSTPMERLPNTTNSRLFVIPYDHRCVRTIEGQWQMCRPCPVVIHGPV